MHIDDVPEIRRLRLITAQPSRKRGIGMTWEIVTGLVLLTSFLVTLVTALAKVIKAFAELSVSNKELRGSIDRLNTTIDKLTDDNDTEHNEIYCKLEDHNIRLVKLEEHK